jgi:archaellum biogenesis ATPase FlaH
VGYIEELTVGIPRKFHIDSYVRIIKEKAALRSIASLCSVAMARAESGESSLDILQALQNGAQLPELSPYGDRRAKVVCLADVQAKAVSWLWPPYIPFGMVSMISGDPGAGKSFIALSLCADVTLGKFGCGHAGALYLTFENPLAEVLRPRFDSLGGDPERFFAITGTTYENGTEDRGLFTFDDIDTLDEVIQEKEIRLVVIDPLTSFFGEGKNANHSTDTRPIFDRLAKLAEKHNCAVVVIRHNNKATGGKAIYRGGGSIDMTGAVRSEMLAAADPQNPDQKALAHIKANVGIMGRTQGYVIEPVGNGGAQFKWTGVLEITAEELNAVPEAPKKNAVEEAREWLVRILRDGPKEQKELEKLADKDGLGWGTVKRAKYQTAGIKSRKLSMSGKWLWTLSEGGTDELDRD